EVRVAPRGTSARGAAPHRRAPSEEQLEGPAPPGQPPEDPPAQAPAPGGGRARRLGCQHRCRTPRAGVGPPGRGLRGCGLSELRPAQLCTSQPSPGRADLRCLRREGFTGREATAAILNRQRDTSRGTPLAPCEDPTHTPDGISAWAWARERKKTTAA